MKGHMRGGKHKMAGHKAGMKKSMREADQHDRATKRKGSKGVGKRLEGKAL